MKKESVRILSTDKKEYEINLGKGIKRNNVYGLLNGEFLFFDNGDNTIEYKNLHVPSVGHLLEKGYVNYFEGYVQLKFKEPLKEKSFIEILFIYEEE